MPTRILITDFVWPSTGPEREVLVAGLGGGVEVVEAPDGSEETLMAALAVDCDAIDVLCAGYAGGGAGGRTAPVCGCLSNLAEQQKYRIANQGQKEGQKNDR